MKINLTIKNNGIGFQIFDAWYGLLQSLMPNYESPVKIHVNAPHLSEDFNILCDYMPVGYSEQQLAKYDLILFCNGGEPLIVSTEAMGNLINRENVYLITNSYLTESHPLKHKAIWFPHNLQTCRDYWTRHFYPQYYENIKNRLIDRKTELIAINGSVRTNRHYFFKLLEQQIPNILQLSTIGTTIHKLNDARWESVEDTQFREWVNDCYRDNSIPEPDHYYDLCSTIGIDGKFGEINPGYFIMPEYFEYACVIFPESTWQNNELAITEKALKCFYTGSLPFPIGGANVNQLYNDIGFYTAWNLLPDDLKQFDQITDHVIRYQQAVVAIDWLNYNYAVFKSDQARSLINQNQYNFLICACDNSSIKQWHDLIKTKLNIDFNSKIQ
jgi:hypothetical protein